MEKWNKISARFTTTPFCVIVDSGDYSKHYFGTLKIATSFRCKKGGFIYKIDRGTGEWHPILNTEL